MKLFRTQTVLVTAICHPRKNNNYVNNYWEKTTFPNESNPMIDPWLFAFSPTFPVLNSPIFHSFKSNWQPCDITRAKTTTASVKTWTNLALETKTDFCISRGYVTNDSSLKSAAIKYFTVSSSTTQGTWQLTYCEVNKKKLTVNHTPFLSMRASISCTTIAL